jgi:NitT/TauT family transport system permease protein
VFRAARSVATFAAVVIALSAAWELIKLLGGDPTDMWKPPFHWQIASDLNMPHVWDIAAAFVEPAQRNGPPLGIVLANAAIFTFREAFGGFVFGAALGLALAILFVHSPLLERALVPYVVASQTVPIIAIAPMVVIWLQAGWLSVAVISAYLTFFPVTIAGVRGIREGLGGAILNFNQFYVSGPPKLWAAIIVAALVGILFFAAVRLAELAVLRGRLRIADS